jgi:hypothetical protein
MYIGRKFPLDPDTKYVKTVPLLTPFSREIGEEVGLEPVPLPVPNYLPYDLLCLKTKLNSYLYQLDPTFTTNYILKELHKEMRLTVEIYKGGKFYPVQNPLADQIQRLINKSYHLYPDYLLLMDARIPIQRGTQTLTRSWVSSMLPFMQLNEKWKPIYDSGRIFINLRDDPEVDDRLSRLRDIIVNLLFTYYNRGVIPCSTRFYSNFIQKWQLSLVHQLPETFDIPNQFALYEPLWSNKDFAPDPVQFLMERLQGKEEIQVYVGDNFVRRHFVAIELRKIDKNLKFIFHDDEVLIPAINIQEAISLTKAVVKGRSVSHGRVQIVPLEDEKAIPLAEEEIQNEYSTLQKGEDYLVYEVLDQPHYILSYLIPVPTMDTMKIMDNVKIQI